jgi:hypothetical protein
MPSHQRFGGESFINELMIIRFPESFTLPSIIFIKTESAAQSSCRVMGIRSVPVLI